jgi:two-component system chemotaxis response regulator CheB
MVGRESRGDVVKPVRVMVVDDSILIRNILRELFKADPMIEVVGEASNGKAALDMLPKVRPDVITLDVEMPEMDGIETLKQIMTQAPTPVVMISAFTEAGAELTFKALDLGAVDFIAKPHAVFSRKLMDIRREILMKIKAASQARVQALDVASAPVSAGIRPKPERKKSSGSLGKCKHIVTIGISTGGPKALSEIMPRFPADLNAAVVIVQHMPPAFTRAFANRLDVISSMEVKEVEPGDVIQRGKAYVAKGDYHLKIEEEKYAFVTRLEQNEKVSLFRPSIDVLMKSTAACFQDRNVGVIMTGMGHDGVEGIRKIKDAGGITLAQDKGTSAIFGMNRLAIESGFVDHVVPLGDIVTLVMNHLN